MEFCDSPALTAIPGGTEASGNKIRTKEVSPLNHPIKMCSHGYDLRIMSKSPIYDNPDAMLPLIPEGANSNLSRLSCEILKASGLLMGQVHSEFVVDELAALVREMNCYYSDAALAN